MGVSETAYEPGPDSQASVLAGRRKARSGRAGGGPGLLKSKVFRGRPVFRRYSAFFTSMHPIPLPALQNAAGGPFWAVLSVLRGLDVYAEGM